MTMAQHLCAPATCCAVTYSRSIMQNKGAGCRVELSLLPAHKTVPVTVRTMQPSLTRCTGVPATFNCHARYTASSAKLATSSLGCRSSMRNFISNECPLPGLGGGYREQPRSATLQASFLAVPQAQLPCPGQRRLLTITDQQLQAIIDDQGQLVLGPLRQPGVVAAPRRGAYTCLARVAGLQRLPAGGGLVRVVVQQRVAVQAMSVNQEPLRCTAAPLPDRWAYFVRLGALEQHAAALSRGAAYPAGPDTSSVPQEVRTAWQQVQDAAEAVQQLLQDLRAAVGSVTDLADGSSSMWLQELLERLEVADELEHMLEWVQEDAAAAATPQQGKEASTGALPGSCTPLVAAERLSYAPLAATSLAAALAALSSRGAATEQATPCSDPSSDGGASSSQRGGGSSDDWVAEGLEATDLGARLELAAEALEEVRAALSARLALAQ